MKPPGDVLATGVAQQALDVEEQVLAGAVVGRAPHRVELDAVEGGSQGAGVGRW